MKHTITLSFEVTADSTEAAEQEAGRLASEIAESYSIDELSHTVGPSTMEGIEAAEEAAETTEA